MTLKKNVLNKFNVSIIIDGDEYPNQTFFIEYFTDTKQKFYYKIIYHTDDINLKWLEKYFVPNSKYIEGVKGFQTHIIGNNNFYLVYCEKRNSLELITYDNSLFMIGKLV